MPQSSVIWNDRDVKLKTQWAYFPHKKRLDQFEFAFQPSIDEKKIRELATRSLIHDILERGRTTESVHKQ
jgi:DNA replication protein DnaC